MTGTPTPDGAYVRQLFNDLDRRLRALESTQQFVFSDPTGHSGDPEHGNAVAVLGSLAAICGIQHFGLAVWNSTTTSGAWVQILG